MSDLRRLVIEIPKDLDDRMNKIMRWGEKSVVFRCVAEDIVKAVETHGRVVLGALLDRSIMTDDIIRIPTITLSQYYKRLEEGDVNNIEP